MILPNEQAEIVDVLGNITDTFNMSIVIDVIQEEADRLNSLIKLYDDKITELPKGSISEKVRGKHLYCYLAYREGGSVKFDYIGPRNSEKVQKLRLKIEKRRKYEKRKRDSMKNLKQVEKLINASKR